ncbi:sel1 repeat family protein [Paraglaciecola aquimarina]|uniref:Sel1 repeat family protein n=1 Tax=Paraglaciecola algarum TaxID=3050085 RepID=A0ABS9D3Q7_9ALTE|nr:sel1 repeat family protein [Paraglaciecola sp. G1-23]MCF2947040.1 sel1 repeat family protein [Paraglaciecola sp. G1-23]
MKFFARRKYTWLVLTSFICTQAFSVDVFKADKLFAEEKYQQAIQEYSQAAKIGSPHAFYQLGTIYHKGLAVPIDNISAYIWFSMASQYDFNDSAEAAQNIYALLTDSQKSRTKELLPAVAASFGKTQVTSQYFPVLNQDLLSEKITFGGDGELTVSYQDEDLILEEIHGSFEDDGFDTNDSFSGDETGAYEFSAGNQLSEMRPGDDLRYSIQLRPEFKFTRRTPFLIVDYDIGPDGSVRNATPVQKIGYSRTLEEKFVKNKFPAPNFQDSRVNFMNRSYIGSAAYARNKMDQKNEALFDKVRRLAKKLKVSEAKEDKYQYAMMLLTFKWLKQQEGEAEAKLKELAQLGDPRAQYELGAKLYREQTNIEQGIYWISESSKYGLAKAEYLLANILKHSPWVVNDEKKALFWYESAMRKVHLAATLKASELRMLAMDKSLHNFESANQYLASMTESQSNNPEYYFLLAIAEKNKANRDFGQVIDYVEKAIRLGQKLNWDVTYWRGLVQKWTTGKVYIVE